MAPGRPTAPRRAPLRSLNDRKFLNAWQIVRAATAPSRDAASWSLSGVEWRQSRQSFATPECAATIETHALDCRAARGPWSILVVVEHWWGPGRVALKSAVWARQLSGNRAAVMAWCEAEARRHTPEAGRA